MKVFLHIGSHKTGTTAIQDFSAAHSDWLLSRRIAYPNLDLIDQKRARSHLGIFGDLANADLTETDGESQRKAIISYSFLQAAERFGHSRGVDLLFSAESLFRFNKIQVDRVCSALRSVFGSAEIIVVCGLRSQAEFAESLYRNGFRAFVKRPQPFAGWMDKGLNRFDYAAIIQSYLQGLQAGYVLLPYSGDTRGNFVWHFFKALGVDVSSAPAEAKVKNPSLDVVDCLAKSIVMRDGVDDKMAKQFNSYAFKNPLITDYAFLGQIEERRLMDYVSDGNRVLLELEPALGSVLNLKAMGRFSREIDSQCMELAQERADQFLGRKTGVNI